MLEIAEKPIKEANIYGEEVKLTSPSLKTAKEFKEQSKINEFEAALDLLENCGMPKSLVDRLDAEHAATVINYLLGDQKN